jgi:hypothetical protein
LDHPDGISDCHISLAFRIAEHEIPVGAWGKTAKGVIAASVLLLRAASSPGLVAAVAAISHLLLALFLDIRVGTEGHPRKAQIGA